MEEEDEKYSALIKKSRYTASTRVQQCNKSFQSKDKGSKVDNNGSETGKVLCVTFYFEQIKRKLDNS